MDKDPGRLPPLDLVRSFECAARELSFTRAAEQLYVTQSAVSRAVLALEDHLGAKLFLRRHRALVLTEAGRELYQAASGALDQLRAACRRIRSSVDTGAVSVTTTIAFASLWLVPRLSDFRERHPEIEVRIVAANDFCDLERQGIDLAIRYCPPKAAPAGAARLFGEQVFPVCSPRLLRKGKFRTPQELQRQVLLHFDDPDGHWPWLQWKVWFEAMKLAAPTGGPRFSHYDQLIQAAISGQGVALGRSPLVRQLIKQGSLAAPLESRVASSRAYFVLSAAGSGDRPSVSHFREWLDAQAGAEREPAG